MGKGTPFTAREIDMIRARYPAEGPDMARDMPTHTRRSIKSKAQQLGIRYIRPPLHIWTEAEDTVIREKWPLVRRRQLHASDVVAELRLPDHWVRRRAMELGVAVTNKNAPPWTEDEEEFICAHAHLGISTLAKRMRAAGYDRSRNGIGQRLSLLGQSTQRTGNMYSCKYLAQLMGVSSKTVRRWVRLGYLPAKPRTDGLHNGFPTEYAVRPESVREFLINHTQHADISRADKHWLIDLLTNRKKTEIQEHSGVRNEALAGIAEYAVCA